MFSRSSIACGVSRPLAACIALALVLMAGTVLAVQPAVEKGKVLKGKAAFGDWRQDAPGVRRHITPDSLPTISPEKPNEVEVVPMPAGAAPRVPEGFTAELVATGLGKPRVIRTAPNGDLFVADSKANEVRVYRVPAGSAKPAASEVFAGGLKKPYGIAFYPPGPNTEWVYVANVDGVVRFAYREGDMKSTSEPETIIEGIQVAHHWTRDIAFSADGSRLFLAVGSNSNVALDMFPKPREPEGGLEAWNKIKPVGAAWDTEDKRATILSYNAGGKDEKIYATGLRNPSGITVHPTSGQLWTVINERDGLGDDTPAEFATRVREGAFYGWPWYYDVKHEDPRQKGARPDLKGKVAAPDVLIQAHSSPLQIVFYDGEGFPAEYKGSAFVTLHGSWDRAKRTGYKVVRLIFDGNGDPTGEYEDFMTGFVLTDKQVWGRPVGVTVGKDGSLFVTEDGSGTIWRVSYAAANR